MRLISVLNFLVVCLYLQFSKCTPDIAGNSTQTGNPVLTGKVFEQDGKLPAVNAKVFIRKRGDAVVFDTTSHNLGNGEISLTTDKNGCYKIDSLVPGLYVIEARKGSGKSFHDSIKIIADSAQYVIDTLGKTGKITGIVYLSDGGDPRKVFVLIYGFNRFVVPDSSGRFVFDSLAKASYDLRFIPTLDLYGVLDTSRITVLPEKITDIDTIKLPYQGIPLVKNIKITFDSMMSVAKIQWNKADTVSTGFYIYRKTVTTNSEVKMNQVPVADLFFIDSSVVNGYKYEYRVTAVDRNGNEGPRGSPSVLVVNTPLRLLATYGGLGNAPGQFTDILDFKILTDSRVVVVDNFLNSVQILDSSGNFVRTWGTSGLLYRPVSIAVNDSDDIFILETTTPGRVQQFDTTGKFIRKWTVASLSNNISYGFNKLFVCHTKIDTTEAGLEVIMPGNNSKSIIHFPGTDITCISRMGDHFLITDQAQHGILIMDTLDYVQKTWTDINWINFRPTKVASSEGRVVALDQSQGKLFMFDSTGHLLSRFNVAEIPPGGTQVIQQKRPQAVVFDNITHTLVLTDCNCIYRYNIP